MLAYKLGLWLLHIGREHKRPLLGRIGYRLRDSGKDCMDLRQENFPLWALAMGTISFFILILSSVPLLFFIGYLVS